MIYHLFKMTGLKGNGILWCDEIMRKPWDYYDFLWSFVSMHCAKSGMETKSHLKSCERYCIDEWWGICTTCFGKHLGMNGVKLMQKNSSFQNAETSKVTNVNNQEERGQ